MLVFGHGYSGAALAARLIPKGWRVIGTTRDAGRVAAIAATGVEPLVWPGDDFGPALAEASCVLVSAGPDDDGDPVLREFAARISEVSDRIDWLGYLSTTGVYGDHGGGWVDEDTPLAPSTPRGAARMKAEAGWQALTRAAGLPLHIFRLAGIYGPGRGPFEKLRSGTARRIIKPGQVISRIHIDDIAQVLEASITRPDPGAVYNVCDDDPAPPQDVIAHAATLLGLPLPPELDFETADLSPMARSFYAESKRVRNDRIKNELGVRLIHPTYRAGLAALLASE